MAMIWLDPNLNWECGPGTNSNRIALHFRLSKCIFFTQISAFAHIRLAGGLRESEPPKPVERGCHAVWGCSGAYTAALF
jgi:hypothetical protein